MFSSRFTNILYRDNAFFSTLLLGMYIWGENPCFRVHFMVKLAYINYQEMG